MPEQPYRNAFHIYQKDHPSTAANKSSMGGLVAYSSFTKSDEYLAYKQKFDQVSPRDSI